jgi:hypothetical protein
LDKHEQEINFLFNHMVNNPPRSSVWIMVIFYYVGVICIKFICLDSSNYIKHR